MESILKQNRPGWRHDDAIWLGVGSESKRNITRLLSRDFYPERIVEGAKETTTMVICPSYFDKRNQKKQVAREAHPFWESGCEALTRVINQLHMYGYIKKAHIEDAYNLAESLELAYQNLVRR